MDAKIFSRNLIKDKVFVPMPMKDGESYPLADADENSALISTDGCIATKSSFGTDPYAAAMQRRGNPDPEHLEKAFMCLVGVASPGTRLDSLNMELVERVRAAVGERDITILSQHDPSWQPYYCISGDVNLSKLLDHAFSFRFKLKEDVSKAIDFDLIERYANSVRPELKYKRKTLFVPVLNINGELLPCEKASFETAKEIKTTSNGSYQIFIQGEFLTENHFGVAQRLFPNLTEALNKYKTKFSDSDYRPNKTFSRNLHLDNKRYQCTSDERNEDFIKRAFPNLTDANLETVSIKEYLAHEAKTVFSIPLEFFACALTYTKNYLSDVLREKDVPESIYNYLIEINQTEDIDIKKLSELFFDEVFTFDFIKTKFNEYAQSSRTSDTPEFYKRMEKELTDSVYQEVRTEFVEMMTSF